LTWFGARITPNEHALAARFGLFDNTYSSGEVSETGHVWADAAFVNDFMERVWSPAYGRRGSDDPIAGSSAAVPQNGYIFDAARRAHVSFRAYGEFAGNPDVSGSHIGAPRGTYDPLYRGWDLKYSDVDRVREWRREFNSFTRSGRLPQLEYIWLPNDHTAGSRAGMLTPVAYAAQNDYATGLIVEAISHSPVWRSSVILIIEDDAQDGPDHVSDQRTTFFLASPFARGGVQHAHYSTVSVLRTMELILGIKPLSVYDGMAVLLDTAFTSASNLRPFDAIPPKVSLSARNGKTAYGAEISAHMDLSRPDVNSGRTLQRILSHNLER